MWIYNYAGVQRGEFTALHLMRTAERAQRSPVVIGVGTIKLKTPINEKKKITQPKFGLASCIDCLLVLKYNLHACWVGVAVDGLGGLAYL